MGTYTIYSPDEAHKNQPSLRIRDNKSYHGVNFPGGAGGPTWGGPPLGFTGKAAQKSGGIGRGTAGGGGTCKSGSGGSATTSPSSPPAQLAAAGA